MIRSVCVYSSSSDAVAPPFVEAAEALGAALARRQVTLVFGGGRVGLMGVVARAVHQHGGRVIGVIPDFMRSKEIAYEESDELVITKTMRERKAIMEERSDAFVTLPGGFGTLEEILEIITLKQLETHSKPVVLLNTRGFFDPLLAMFEQLYREGFTKEQYRGHYHVAAEPEAALHHLENYQPPPRVRKWFAAESPDKHDDPS